MSARSLIVRSRWGRPRIKALACQYIVIGEGTLELVPPHYRGHGSFDMLFQLAADGAFTRPQICSTERAGDGRNTSASDVFWLVLVKLIFYANAKRRTSSELLLYLEEEKKELAKITDRVQKQPVPGQMEIQTQDWCGCRKR